MAGVVVSFGNSLSGGTKARLHTLLDAHGGKVSFFVTKEVNYMVAHPTELSDETYKIRSAKKLGIPCIPPEELEALLAVAPQASGTVAGALSDRGAGEGGSEGGSEGRRGEGGGEGSLAMSVCGPPPAALDAPADVDGLQAVAAQLSSRSWFELSEEPDSLASSQVRAEEPASDTAAASAASAAEQRRHAKLLRKRAVRTARLQSAELEREKALRAKEERLRRVAEEQARKREVRLARQREWESKRDEIEAANAAIRAQEQAEQGRKLFFGNLHCGAPADAGMMALCFAAFRGLLGEFGEVEHVRVSAPQRWMFAVFAQPSAAEGAYAALQDHKRRQSIVDRLRAHTEKAGGLADSAPKPTFYVRWPLSEDAKRLRRLKDKRAEGGADRGAACGAVAQRVAGGRGGLAVGGSKKVKAAVGKGGQDRGWKGAGKARTGRTKARQQACA
mmetsp:Transcript_36519/g.91546  ORF Transcript_36519/g.91546 Transcript_36519/m.91546 type:complete len:447 (+) Transcript_36519:70-1410(+)